MANVLITGSSTGIGAACALHFDRLGWTVYAGVRKDADADDLRRKGSAKLTPVLIDVTDQSQIDAVAKQIEADSGRLDGLVEQRGHRSWGAAREPPARRVAHAARGQRRRPGRRHQGDAAADPPRQGQGGLHRVDRWPPRQPAHGSVQRIQVRHRGSWSLAPPGAQAQGRPRVGHRARGHRHPDLGQGPGHDGAAPVRAAGHRPRGVRRAARNLREGPGHERQERRGTSVVAKVVEHVLTAKRPRRVTWWARTPRPSERWAASSPTAPSTRSSPRSPSSADHGIGAERAGMGHPLIPLSPAMRRRRPPAATSVADAHARRLGQPPSRSVFAGGRDRPRSDEPTVTPVGSRPYAVTFASVRGPGCGPILRPTRGQGGQP